MDELDRKIDEVLNNMRKKEKLSDEFKEKLIEKLEEYAKELDEAKIKKRS